MRRAEPGYRRIDIDAQVMVVLARQLSLNDNALSFATFAACDTPLAVRVPRATDF
jgi:hypothetical protein